MAITVASDRTVFNATGGDAESYTNWTETAAWSTAGVIDGDMYLQGANCIGARASAAAGPTLAVFWSSLTTAANLNLTGFHVYFWIKCISLPAMETRARGGIGLSISSTAAVALDATAPWTTLPWRGITDSSQWFLTGSDFETESGWVCYVVDPFSTPDFSRNTPDMTSVDRIGIRAAVLQVVGAGSFKPKNVLWDYMSYQTKLTITGSTGTFQDIYTADSTTANQYGILRKAAGVFLGAGKLIFGTTGQSAPCVMTDTNQTLVWQDFRVASSFYEIQLVGNTTPNVTTVTFGTYSGGLSSGGCTIKGVGLNSQRLVAPVIVSGGTGGTYAVGNILTVVGGTGTVAAQFEVWAVTTGVITAIVMKTAGSYSVPPTGTLTVTGGGGTGATFTATVVGGSIWTLTASAANQTLNLYACTLSEMLSAALTTTSTLRGCTFTNSGTITTGGALIDSCTFQDLRTATPISATYGLIIASTTEMSNVTNCKFINCGRAIKITAAGTYNFVNLTFSGNTYDIENSSAGTVTINNLSGSNTSTYINTGGGSTSIVTSVNVTITIINQAGTAIPGAEVAIFQDNAARTVILASTSTNASGQVTTTATASLGAIIVRARQSTNKATFATTAGVDGATEVITTDANHNFRDGDAVVYSKNGGTASIGLTAGTTYYVNNISATTLSLHTTAANAIADTSRVDLTAAGAETHHLDPIRYVANSATGTISTVDFSLSMTLNTDIIATG